jgi:hypothetical protein
VVCGFAISLCFPRIRFVETDDADSIGQRDTADEMERLVQIPDGDASGFTVAKAHHRER